MKSIAGTLAAPFPYFGGKSNAAETVWCSPACVPLIPINADLFSEAA